MCLIITLRKQIGARIDHIMINRHSNFTENRDFYMTLLRMTREFVRLMLSMHNEVRNADVASSERKLTRIAGKETRIRASDH